MTKIKNTKKGMAKKTLSMSLVVAMLATSNVPVWAAEFSDGTDDVAVATEAPAAEAFSDAATEAPVVEDNTNAVEAQDASTSVTADVTFKGADSNNTINWWENKELEADISSVKINGVEFNSNFDAIFNKYSLTYAWKVNGVAEDEDDVSFNNGSYEVDTYEPTETDAGKTISLILMLKEEGSTPNDVKTIWSQEFGSFTVNYRQVSDCVKVNESEIPTPEYDGEEHKESVSQALLMLIDTTNGTGDNYLTNESNYDVTYSGKDYVNVTEDGITVTLTPKADKLPGYAGSISYTYKISPKELTGYASNMVATITNTSYTYTGNTITKVKASDIKLVDKNDPSVDLSNYLNVDKDGYVGISSDANAALKNADDEKTLWVDLIQGVPETGCQNYKITPEDQVYRRIETSNKLKVTARDLSTVNITIPAQSGSSDGKAITIDPDTVTFKDKTTGEKLSLADDVKIEVPENAKTKGSYTATIKANTENVTGKATANFNIVAADLSTATFTNENSIANCQKQYTGEQITFTAKELGSLTLDDKTIDPSLYDITFGENINAKAGKTDEGVIIIKGKGDFEGSEKRIYFDIVPASLDEANTKANEYVEIIDTKKYSDYAESMGIVVKAKNADKKEFTLKEGTDYTVEYSCNNNAKGGTVTATITIINDSFKGDKVSTTVSSTITEKAIKDANIKLKETDFTYTGKAVEPDFDVVIDGKIINPDLYEVSYKNNLNAGTATIEVTGKGDKYSDQATAKATFTIKPADASKLEGTLPSKSYKGYSLEVPADEINVTLNGEKINVKDNFTVTYGENVQIGDGTVILTPKNGNFTGTKTLTFKIVAELLKDGSLTFYDKNGVKVNDPDFYYDGTAHTYGKVTFSTTDADGDYITEHQNDAGNWEEFSKKLTEGTDYEIKYVDNVYGKDHIGAVLVVAKGKFGGAYEDEDLGIKDGVYTDAEGNKTANVIYAEGFVIAPQLIHRNNISISNGTYAGGLPVKPQVSIVVNGKTLVEGKDFEVITSLDSTEIKESVEHYLLFNTDLANATTGNTLYAVIRGLNGYDVAGSESEDDRYDSPLYKWGIDKFDLANADVTVEDGKVTVKCGRVDVETSEYTVEQKDGKVTVTANKNSRNYTGSKTVSAVTEDQKPGTPMISSVKVVGNKATAILSGDTDGASGYDYVISTDRDCITNKDYDSVNKNQVQTSTTFKYVQQGTYYAYCHAWKRDKNGKKVFSDWSNAYPFVVSAITPDAPVITKVTVSGSTIKVTYKAAANATGYDVVLGTGSKKENGETRPHHYGNHKVLNLKEGTVTATFKKVPKGTWVVGMHAFNRTSEDGKKVFSPWSNLMPAEVE